VPGSLYDFVRRHLVANGGTCSREELLAALQSDPVMRERLARARGFTALVNNMRFSGDVTVDRDRVTATSRTYRRLNIVPPCPVRPNLDPPSAAMKPSMARLSGNSDFVRRWAISASSQAARMMRESR
jgi:hypothetical protein